jgi:DNA replication and repair protein RecF
VLVTGANGVGKTNLLEGLHVGAQGFSPRTRNEPRLVRFGDAAARVRLAGSEQEVPFETQVDLAPSTAKRIRLNGAPLSTGEELRLRLSALAFTPDRLAVVKSGPIVRRAYLDRMLGRLFPARAKLAADYAAALAQRNTSLRRARSGDFSLDAVAPWTEQVARLGDALDRARGELVDALAPGFAGHASALGLADAEIAYAPQGLTRTDLEARLDRDLERGTTSVGPHLRDAAITAGGRELRAYGSQGEQRTAVLALVLAESGLVSDRRGEPPLLLLDDVFSELDRARGEALVAQLPAGSQTVVTATERPAALAPDLVVEVTPGRARAA